MKTFQELNLSIGERASNRSAYPRKSLVVVECIKDFNSAPDSDHVINNASSYVKVIHYGLIGLSTSHLISSSWVNEDVRFK